MEDWFYDEELAKEKRGKVCPFTILENTLQNIKHNDLQTLWQGKDHPFQNGMVSHSIT
jgi:hypothetical protein